MTAGERISVLSKDLPLPVTSGLEWRGRPSLAAATVAIHLRSILLPYLNLGIAQNKICLPTAPRLLYCEHSMMIVASRILNSLLGVVQLHNYYSNLCLPLCVSVLYAAFTLLHIMWRLMATTIQQLGSRCFHREKQQLTEK